MEGIILIVHAYVNYSLSLLQFGCMFFCFVLFCFVFCTSVDCATEFSCLGCIISINKTN